MTQRLRRRRVAYQRRLNLLVEHGISHGASDAERDEIARLYWLIWSIDARLYVAAERWVASPERERAPKDDEHRLVLEVDEDLNPDGIRCGTFANLRPAEGA